jgi:hypothetical protein
MSELPIACTLAPDALRLRREELLPGLVRRAETRELLATGVRLQFASSADVLGDIVRMIDAERQCCRFLRFELSVAPDLAPITLDVTGPAGTAEFLAGLIKSTDDTNDTDRSYG